MNAPGPGLDELARDALRAYALDVSGCEFAARAFNTVYRVDTADGGTYALRVGPTLRIHAEGCEEAEAAWVASLHDAGVPTPRVIAARDGSPVARTPDGRPCVLFEWVDGVPLREQPTTEAIVAAGALAARLHELGAAARPETAPPGVIVADRVLSFRVPDRLDELRPVYGAAIAEAVARAQAALDRLWRDPPHPPHLLHGDLQPGNVMVAGERVTVIDFQDLIFGFEVQDAWIAVHGFEGLDERGGAVAALRAGYERVRPWPAADRETVGALRVARHLNMLNFGLTRRKPGLDDFVARNAAPAAAWMRGELPDVPGFASS